jgi:hypothetical protein
MNPSLVHRSDRGFDVAIAALLKPEAVFFYAKERASPVSPPSALAPRPDRRDVVAKHEVSSRLGGERGRR